MVLCVVVLLIAKPDRSFELPAGTSQLSLDQASRNPQLRLCTTVSEVIPALQDIREALYAQYPLLPPEVIGRIFRLVAQDDRSFSLHRITHVCRHWRYLAISDPSLWTNVRLNVNAAGVEYTTTLIQRSGSLPLSVDFECAWYRKNPMCRFARAVMTHYQRIRRLRLSTVPVVPALNRILAHYSSCSWDALDSLFVNASNVDFVWRTAPRLRFLSITSLDTQRISPSSFRFATLRSLRVVGRGNIEVAGWTDALSQMPRLEELYFDIWTPGFGPFGIEPDHVQRSGTVALNCLMYSRALVVSGCRASCSLDVPQGRLGDLAVTREYPGSWIPNTFPNGPSNHPSQDWSRRPCSHTTLSSNCWVGKGPYRH